VNAPTGTPLPPRRLPPPGAAITQLLEEPWSGEPRPTAPWPGESRPAKPLPAEQLQAVLAPSLETAPVAAAPLPVAAEGALPSLSTGLRNRNCGSQPVRLLYEKVWRGRKGNLIAWGEHLADQSTLLTCEKREASSSDKDGTPETDPTAKISLVVARPVWLHFGPHYTQG